MLHCNRVCISRRFQDNGPKTYRGHELDSLGLRDVIDHVTIRMAVNGISC